MFVAWVVTSALGFVMTSYGVMRQSFFDASRGRGFGEGRYGEGVYGGGLSRLQELIVRIGIALKLLPKDRNLSLTDQKRNAAFTVVGVFFLALALILDIFDRYCNL